MSASRTGSELFIVDNSEADWKVRDYLAEWCGLSGAIDIATGYFEIGALLALDERWQAVDRIRILMGDEVSLRTRRAFAEGLHKIGQRLDASLEAEKVRNDFLHGRPAIVEAIRAGKIQCRVYRKDKFHAKAYLTHARAAVIGSFGSGRLVELHPSGSERKRRIECPDLAARRWACCRTWYERHWEAAEDIAPDILRTLERHTEPCPPFVIWFKALRRVLSRPGTDAGPVGSAGIPDVPAYWTRISRTPIATCC